VAENWSAYSLTRNDDLAAQEICKTVVAELGGPSQVAKIFGLHTIWSIQKWTRIPAGRVVDIAELTGRTPNELRPDIFRNVRPGYVIGRVGVA
jgi:DNA-binding transcriptional regulator YdaS (Cro superfamily)